MQAQLFTAAIVGLAMFFAFGEMILASSISTPGGFVEYFGRAIGLAISGAISSVMWVFGI